MTEAEKKFLVDLQGLLFFKSEQDKENLEKFIKKDEALSSLGAISYLIKQNLTETQKAQARENIGAGTGDGTGSIEGAVRYDVEQSLDDDDKARARANIGTTDGTWENMPDKPFGINGWVIEWDANPTDTFVPVEGSDGFYKVSDTVLTKDELIGATLKAEFDGNHIDMVLSDDNIADYSADCYGMANNAFFFVTTQATEFDLMGEISLSFPSAGVWFIYSSGVTWAYYLGKGELKKIDKEFLPDDLKVELPEGLVTTDENGLIPASMLPSYVDDVVEGYYWVEPNYEPEFRKEDGSTITPESGKIYVDLNTGNTYRWSGSVYVQLNPKEYTIATNDQILELFN